MKDGSSAAPFATDMPAAQLDANDVFATIATTRGWLSNGNTSALVAEGGAGNDSLNSFGIQSGCTCAAT